MAGRPSTSISPHDTRTIRGDADSVLPSVSIDPTTSILLSGGRRCPGQKGAPRLLVPLNASGGPAMLRAVAVRPDIDDQLRSSAFSYLDRLIEAGGGPVTRTDLQAFRFEGRRIPLVSPQTGIWKPAGLTAALSILTTFVPPTEVPP